MSHPARAEIDRIRWHCRRGLLELDLVLAAFVEKRLPGLDAGQREVFAELLDHSDNDLLDLVMGRAETGEPRHEAVLALIRGM